MPDPAAQAVARSPFGAFANKDPREALAQVGTLQVKELEFTSIVGEPVYLATLSDRASRIIPVDGDPIEIAFNARFLSDVLGVLNAPQVALETSTAASPGVVKPVGRDDFTHVIMPMHIGR